MSIYILLIKVLLSLLFLILYGYQWASIKSKEAKIGFLFFFTFYYVGGIINSIIIEDVNQFFPESGLYQVTGSGLSWLIYFTIIYLVPYVFVWIIDFILRDENYSHEVYPANLKWVGSLFFAYIIYVCLNIDIEQILNFKELGYSNQVNNRYELNYTSSFQFFTLVGGFLLCYYLSISNVLLHKGVRCWIVIIVVIMTYLFIVERVFYSKLYFIGLCISILFSFFILSKVSKLKMALAFVLFFLLFLLFYNFSVYGGGFKIILPALKAISRYSTPIYYYVDYYILNDFEGGFYLSGVLLGKSHNYISDVYSYAFLFTDTDVVGTLSSGLIIHNFVNVGIFSVVLSFLEFSIVISLYKAFKTKVNIVLNLSVFSFLIFSVMNFNLTSLFFNSKSGLFFIFLILFMFKILGRLNNETNIARHG